MEKEQEKMRMDERGEEEKNRLLLYPYRQQLSHQLHLYRSCHARYRFH
jgi:hypothetical protein